MGALSAWLNLSDISSPMHCLTSSLVLHYFVVLSLIGTLTHVGLGFQVWLSSLWMDTRTFFWASFFSISFTLVASSISYFLMASLSRMKSNSLCIHGDFVMSFLVLSLHSLDMVIISPTECCIGLLMLHRRANLLTLPLFLTFLYVCNWSEALNVWYLSSRSFTFGLIS